MKKTKLHVLLILLVIGGLFITGCKKEEKETVTNNEPKTVAATLSKSFESIAKKEKSIEKMAQTIANNEVIIPEMQTFEIGKDDYLAGFKEEIKGFKNAYGIAPMIGTIPFIGYVFEVENPEEFVKTLKEYAQLDWNICTQADEMKISTVDNYVFFVMSPNTFEE